MEKSIEFSKLENMAAGTLLGYRAGTEAMFSLVWAVFQNIGHSGPFVSGVRHKSQSIPVELHLAQVMDLSG
jgi:hypothetical protein